LASSNLNLQPKQIVTRFILPFSFDRNRAAEGSEKLSRATIINREGKETQVWECCNAPRLYREEMLPNVRDFLFGGESRRGCRYLRVTSGPANIWFKDKDTRANLITEEDQEKAQRMNRSLPGLVKLPITLAANAGIEMFLTNYGVGLLSIALTPHGVPDLETTILFNYRLVQSRPNVARGIRKQHQLDGQSSPLLTEHERANITPRPAPDAPLADRISTAGGEFLLWELATEILLAPLATWNLKPFQSQFSVYTCILFNDTIDFNNAEVSKSLSPFLSAVTQVEEPSHAGSPQDRLSVKNEILNRRHWTAAGLLGTAHIIADQPNNHTFNEQRMTHVVMKYFAPCLAVMIQRASLQGTINEASDYVLKGNEAQLPRVVSDLRQRMLKFAVEGYFPEISHRDAVDRYYRMLQQGLGVRRAYEDVNRAIADMDKQLTAEHQAQVQHKIGLLERFIVSVYAAELWHLIASNTELSHRRVIYGIIGFAILGFIGAWALDRLWKEKPSQAT
jgi:hypothetical protein